MGRIYHPVWTRNILQVVVDQDVEFNPNGRKMEMAFFNADGSSAELAGAKGDPGSSAYDIWLAEGNVGTIDDYLASLQGPQGDIGPEGPAGADGAAGPAGSLGPTGPVLGFVAASAIETSTNMSVAPTEAPTVMAGGYTVQVGDVLWFSNTMVAADKGLWVYNGPGQAYTRAPGWQTGVVCRGTEIQIANGTWYAGRKWVVTTAGPITVGTTAIAFAEKFDTWLSGSVNVNGDMPAGTYVMCRDGVMRTLAQINATHVMLPDYQYIRGTWVCGISRYVTQAGAVAMGQSVQIGLAALTIDSNGNWTSISNIASGTVSGSSSSSSSPGPTINDSSRIVPYATISTQIAAGSFLYADIHLGLTNKVW